VPHVPSMDRIGQLGRGMLTTSEGRQLDPAARIQRLAAEGDKGQSPHFRHPGNGMIVTVAGHLSKDGPIGTLKAILPSAGLKGASVPR
jgi:predicted RNA binding protein YcfA (HicA-like mRNA interferase family)